ncbi:hypothetical protein FDK38_004277 [Candidozyma auris]|nr:hypothetical protein FDK38_004277 [[Candida] auris]
MGKRNFKTGKGFTKRDKKETNGNGQWTDVKRENEKWENYYKSSGLIPDDEWDTFKEHCQRDLPLTFRITGSRKHALEVNQKFIDDHVSKLQDEEFEGQKLAPKNIEFYPANLGWQLDVPKSVIRKNAQFADTQRFLVLETVVGNISRQEAVSMIPPLLMDVKPHHAVLDMCAAPGSKTAQLVEALHANDEQELASGFVIANDSDYKRSHMLVHQVKRLNSPNFLVVNHDASMFPRINIDGQIVKFDRILCDVPCSGDGTMRKNVNVWKDFTVGNGLGLHSLQVNILNRGLQLLKPGGRLVYSTCSMSPIENEAVVAEAMRKWNATVKIKDCSEELPGLKRRPGVSNWKVYGKDMNVREKGDESVPASAFPPSEEEAKQFHLDRCIRVYPHLQNTGGFFITVFEKEGTDNQKGAKRAASTEAEVDSKKQKIEPSAEAPQRKQKAPRTANEEPFVFLDPENDQLKSCWEFYGINDKFPKNTALVRNAMGEPARVIYYVSPSIASILKIEEQKLKLVHAGIKMFTVQRNDSSNCPWRVQSESLHTLKNFLSGSRSLFCNTDILQVLLQEAFLKIETLRETGLDNEFCDKLEGISEGCLFLTVKREGLEDAIFPLWKGRSNVNLMVNKQDTQELLMRLFNIATSAKDEGKEKKHQKEIESKRSSEQPEEMKEESNNKSKDAEAEA